MIKVISPFSLLNDDLENENGRILPIPNLSYTDNIGFGNINAPFFIIFTDNNR